MAIPSEKCFCTRFSPCLEGTESEISAPTNINWLNNQRVKESTPSDLISKPISYKRKPSLISELKPVSSRFTNEESDELIKVLKNSISVSNLKFNNEWVTYGYENIPAISNNIIEKVETIKTETNDTSF